MGGLFKAPKASSGPSASAAVAAAAAAAPVPVADPVVQEEQKRQSLEQRALGGRAGTIDTSARGLMTPADWVPQRKSLLGE